VVTIRTAWFQGNKEKPTFCPQRKIVSFNWLPEYTAKIVLNIISPITGRSYTHDLCMGVANIGLHSSARQCHRAADSQFSNKWYYRQMQFSLNRFSVVTVYSLMAVLTNIDIYDMIYLLAAIGLSPGGSITVHIYTQTIHGTNTNNN
jgi:hypothetical protein